LLGVIVSRFFYENDWLDLCELRGCVTGRNVCCDALEIVGPGKALLAIDGGGDGDFLVESGEVRVFSFAGSTVAEPHRVTDLTIRNGTSILGGANIRVFGSLELVRCEISGGRGVAANPSVNGNTTENADGGGVFHSQGPMLVEACEIFENGTIGNFSQGGGLYSENGSLTIRGSRPGKGVGYQLSVVVRFLFSQRF